MRRIAVGAAVVAGIALGRGRRGPTSRSSREARTQGGFATFAFQVVAGALGLVAGGSALIMSRRRPTTTSTLAVSS